MSTFGKPEDLRGSTKIMQEIVILEHFHSTKGT